MSKQRISQEQRELLHEIEEAIANRTPGGAGSAGSNSGNKTGEAGMSSEPGQAGSMRDMLALIASDVPVVDDDFRARLLERVHTEVYGQEGQQEHATTFGNEHYSYQAMGQGAQRGAQPTGGRLGRLSRQPRPLVGWWPQKRKMFAGATGMLMAALLLALLAGMAATLKLRNDSIHAVQTTTAVAQLAGRGTGTPPTGPVLAEPGAGQTNTPEPTTPTLSGELPQPAPPPVYTGVPTEPLPSWVPFPSPTPVPYTPEPQPTLPPPPAATPLAPQANPVPNIAWAAQSSDHFTIWVGHYNDSPSPTVTGARPVARWKARLGDDSGDRYSNADWYLRLASMAISPNHRYLAVLLAEQCAAPPPEPTPTPGVGPALPRSPAVGTACEGDWPSHAFVLDLSTNQVQPIPDYFKNYQLYSENYYLAGANIMGWFDNDRFGIEAGTVGAAGRMLTATRDGSSLESRPFPGEGPKLAVFRSTLLPDHRTIFVWAGDKFYLRDAATGVPRKVGDRIAGEWYDYPSPSPDAHYLAYLDPEPGQTGNDGVHYSLWVQDLATGAHDMLVSSGVWDTSLAWSPDGSQIAFARADKALGGDQYRWVGNPNDADTNIYLASVSNRSARPLTHFTGAHNSGIRWASAGNLVLSSTAGSQSGLPGIVAVSTKSGQVATLVSPDRGESLVYPLLFDSTSAPAP